MRTFDRSKIDPWLLSGEPVCRLYGRDFDMSPSRYSEWLLELARNYQIEIQLKVLVEPPGVVVRAFLPTNPPADKLVDPLFVVNKHEMPWLYCVVKGCELRLADSMPPGGVCEQHRGR